MEVFCDVDKLHAVKLQDTFGLSLNCRLVVTLCEGEKSMSYEVFNYPRDNNCYVEQLEKNGEEVSKQAKDKNSLQVAGKTSIAKVLITTTPFISNKNLDEKVEELIGEIESTIRSVYLNINLNFDETYNTKKDA